MRRTKIVCTIGPSSEELQLIKDLIGEGMDVARLNFSHGPLEDHLQRLQNIRLASRELGRRVGLLVDLKGPEVRLKDFWREGEELQEGDPFILTVEDIVGNKTKVGVTYKRLPYDLQPGNHVLIDDGLIDLKVESVTATDVLTVVVHGGKIFSRKSVNLPGVSLGLPYLSREDERDIDFALEHDLDFIAASFVSKPDDIFSVRSLVENKNSMARIIAKIENSEGVDNFESILQAADGIMIARGDLGVEIPAEDVPLVQKKLIATCNNFGKPVITATQMLDSMIRNPRPTRAEASDVANAIFDGTDALMLSGETAAGLFPVQAVRTMAIIAKRTEEDLEYKKNMEVFDPPGHKTVTDVISFATCRASQELGAAAIITATQSGHTARMVSKYKPRAPIVAVTPSEKVAATLMLTWGVYPLLSPLTAHTDEIFDAGVDVALSAGLICSGDLVVLTAGVPVGVTGTTNYMRIDTVGEIIIQGQGLGRISVTGQVHMAFSAREAFEIEKGQILVAKFTDKSYLPAMEKAGAIITESGGLTSHAAIVGLSLGIPVVVGAERATEVLTSRQIITMDGTRGLIYRGRAKVG